MKAHPAVVKFYQDFKTIPYNKPNQPSPPPNPPNLSKPSPKKAEQKSSNDLSVSSAQAGRGEVTVKHEAERPAQDQGRPNDPNNPFNGFQYQQSIPPQQQPQQPQQPDTHHPRGYVGKHEHPDNPRNPNNPNDPVELTQDGIFLLFADNSNNNLNDPNNSFFPPIVVQTFLSPNSPGSVSSSPLKICIYDGTLSPSLYIYLSITHTFTYSLTLSR